MEPSVAGSIPDADASNGKPLLAPAASTPSSVAVSLSTLNADVSGRGEDHSDILGGVISGAGTGREPLASTEAILVRLAHPRAAPATDFGLW